MISIVELHEAESETMDLGAIQFMQLSPMHCHRNPNNGYGRSDRKLITCNSWNCTAGHLRLPSYINHLQPIGVSSDHHGD